MAHNASSASGECAKRAVSVVVDTSAILCCVADSRDVIEALEEAVCSEVEILVPESVMKELERLSKRWGRKGKLARTALGVLTRHIDEGPLKLVKGREGGTDTVVLELSLASNSYVATADTRMAVKARALGVPTLMYRRAKKRFELS